MLRSSPRRTIYGVAAIVFLTTVFFNISQWGRRSVQPRRLIDDVYNSTLGFEGIFVVGLPSRTDRRDGMILQAALSHMELQFVDGVSGKEVPDKAIPKSHIHDRIPDPSIGSWRGHMNAVQEIVRRNLSSALIFEDDIDWDIRIKHQLHDFALASQALSQPLVGLGRSLSNISATSSPPMADLAFDDLPPTEPPKISPYGDNWDLLWLGHCGSSFAFANSKVPKARIIRLDDETVAKKEYLWSLNSPFELVDKYPQHTRAYHHAQEAICTLAYAVSRRGALKLLQEAGLRDVPQGYDFLVRYYCEGDRGMAKHECLTLQPGLFHHHRPTGPASDWSDIGQNGDEFHDTSRTDMIRWSVRLNVDQLANGRTDFIEQYPD